MALLLTVDVPTPSSYYVYWGARSREHPEAPRLGEQVLYVDLAKYKLKKLFNS